MRNNFKSWAFLSVLFTVGVYKLAFAGIDLEVSEKELHFNASPNSQVSVLKREVKMKNKMSYEVIISSVYARMGAPFQATANLPAKLAKDEEVTVTVSYIPNGKETVIDTEPLFIDISIAAGPTFTGVPMVSLSAYEGPSAAVPSAPELKFDAPANAGGMVSTQSVEISNVSPFTVVVSLDQPAGGIFSFEDAKKPKWDPAVELAIDPKSKKIFTIAVNPGTTSQTAKLLVKSTDAALGTLSFVELKYVVPVIQNDPKLNPVEPPQEDQNLELGGGGLGCTVADLGAFGGTQGIVLFAAFILLLALFGVRRNLRS